MDRNWLCKNSIIIVEMKDITIGKGKKQPASWGLINRPVSIKR